MSTKPLMLEQIAGGSSRVDSDEIIRRLRREKEDAEEQLRIARREIEDLQLEKERIERSIKVLRQQLSPLHRGLRAVFGEIELAIGEEQVLASSPASAAPCTQHGDDPRWQSYKNQFPGAPSKIIDALLSHQQMTLTQLSTLLRMHYNTAKDAVSKLVKAGAITRDGGVCRLNR